MKIRISPYAFPIFVGSLVLAFLTAWYTFAFTGPTQTPPGCPSGQPGCDPPINISGTAQTKAGDLDIHNTSNNALLTVDILDVNPGNATFNGNVGVGHFTPQHRLTIAQGGNLAWEDSGNNVRGFIGIPPATDDMTFRVGAVDRMVIDNTTGNVGIGTGNPTDTLHLERDGTHYLTVDGGNNPNSSVGLKLVNTNGSREAYIAGYQGDLRFLVDPGGSPSNAMYIDTAGNVGIGTTSPSSRLHVAGNARVTGTLQVNKLTVNTIDPVYEIDGHRYATYGADTAGGTRIETSGTLTVKDRQAVIKLDSQEVGSTLWLFWEVSSQSLEDIVVLLTPGFGGTIWYEKDFKNNSIMVRADRDGEVSFRLTAPRKDFAEWPNRLEE